VKKTAIEVQHLSKIYRLGEVGTVALSQDIERWWKMRILGQEDPFLKIGTTGSPEKNGIVHSLREVSFEIGRGEAVGIIGRNGAGKSTLLKLLSRVTAPSSGRVRLRGRVASMLEVGTGFHPELTGRENIYLNGAILGMTKHEINSKLDEIIDFSGVDMYIDTPVKRYSSGMYVRLAFAVAAHLESEILIVDEVLAVGDTEFQQKCLGKMGDAGKKEGRTVLFVSHNMAAISALCDRTIVLEKGQKIFDGLARDGVERYLWNNLTGVGLEKIWNADEAPGDHRVRLLSVKAAPVTGNLFTVTSGVSLEFHVVSHTGRLLVNLVFQIMNKDQILVLQHGTVVGEGAPLRKGVYKVTAMIPGNTLNLGTYTVNVWLGGHIKPVREFQNVVRFTVEHISTDHIIQPVPGIMRPVLEYHQTFSETDNVSIPVQ
jgi:lipopolysaccharide transport system ATP-binding protein